MQTPSSKQVNSRNSFHCNDKNGSVLHEVGKHSALTLLLQVLDIYAILGIKCEVQNLSEKRGGSRELMIQTVKKSKKTTQHRPLKMAESFKERLRHTVRHYKHVYDVSCPGYSDKQIH